MSIFFCTPMYGSKCFGAFHRSAMKTAIELTRVGMPWSWSTPWNESLIPRARNNLVAEFLETEFDTLMFIDADIEFDPKDISLLWNLDVDIACGAYKIKREGAPLTVWRNGKLDDIEGETKPFECDFAGTGFILIKRHVFEMMIETYPELEYGEYIFTEDNKQVLREAKQTMTAQEYHELEEKLASGAEQKYALFDTMIHNRTYLSEDYTFCHRWREMGGKIICHPEIKLRHWGLKAYD